MLACVREIGSNLAYVRKELPGLEVPAAQREEFLRICGALSREVDGLQARTERLAGGSLPGDMDAIQADIRSQATRLDEWVMAARTLAAAEPKCLGVEILLEESGANMLLAYLGMRKHLEALRAQE